MIKFDLFPGGKKKALTMSYDDGTIFDRRLVEIFNKYGIKGTFHINSGLCENKERKVQPEEMKELYKGHEVAVHGVEHHTLTKISPQNMVQEILEDRRTLEKWMGYPVRGMSYANGAYNDEVCDALHSCGIVYSRTTKSTNAWKLPDDFLKWHPTCHHKDAMAQAERFSNWNYQAGYLLYIWGHSYEFDNDNNWDMMEELCRKLGGKDDIWYATNIEIYDYVAALKNLIISVDNDIITNPSAIDVWVNNSGDVLKIPAGQTVKL